MPRELPNLDWLRVFAATAATESFALAANELGVTPGAVSQRIKSLEAFLGLALFQRHAQGVRLTEAGKKYAQRVQQPLDQLLLATREVVSTDSAKQIRLTVLPALAQLWLGPRLDDFHTSHESTTVEIWADPTVIDLRTSNFDMALRYGRPPFPGCEYQDFLVDELILVASPALLATANRDADGLPIGVPLMLDTYWTDDFNHWLRSTGTAAPKNLVTQTFSLYSMVIDATLNGRGFMIGHTSLLSDLVEQGRLQVISPKRVPALNQFYLLTKSPPAPGSTAEAFIHWTLAQARLTEARIAEIFGG